MNQEHLARRRIREKTMNTKQKSPLIWLAHLLVISCVIAVPAVAQDGKALYEDKCAHCHGIKGDGEGDAAVNLLPRPRDFTRGLYKIRSTESGQLPTDQDIYDIIANGMPGSSMPAWKDILNAAETKALVAYVKTFHDGFKDASPRAINLSDKIAYTAESAAKGREIYKKIECNACHGEVGRGDGASAPDLKDEWGFKTWPANMTQPWTFRGGTTTEDIFKRFIGGIAGSPMPSFVSSFRIGLTEMEEARMTELEEKDEMTEDEEAEYETLDEKVIEYEDLMFKLADGEELEPAEQQKLDVALKPIFVEFWHLANYVKSVAPEETPKPAVGDRVMRSKYREGELPGINDEAWNEIEVASYYPLVGQVIIDQRQFNPTIDSVTAKSFYNDSEVAFRFTWDDRTKSLPEENDAGEMPEDVLAIQFPIKVSQNPTDPKPYFIWGGRRAVNLWHWKVSEPDKVTEMTAKGISNATPQPPESQAVQSAWAYDNGQYQLWVKRDLKTDDKKDLQFEPSIFIPIAFSAWDGSNGDINTKRAISTWYTFILEPVPSTRRFIYPPIVALITAGLLFALRGVVQRREEEETNR